MKTRTYLTGIVSLMVNAVLFGAGVVVVLSVPALSEHAIYLIPAVVVASFILTPFIAWKIAPRMRLSYWKERENAA
ncbi:hypothetical protein ABGN05_05620 [Aquibium sp. LZ166]|uniref:Uncharacterized protein n=1 Tax=Aquibium pacificus TaxID=3153579 RepID=A0ABV3SEG0_9HYPH